MEYSNRQMQGVEWWPDLRDSWVARFSEPPGPRDGSDIAKDVLDTKRWAKTFRGNVQRHEVEYALMKLRELPTLGLQPIMKYHLDNDVIPETHGEKLRLE